MDWTAGVDYEDFSKLGRSLPTFPGRKPRRFRSQFSEEVDRIPFLDSESNEYSILPYVYGK